MTAVNLIPHEQRPGRFSVSTSPQTLAVFGALAAVLVALVLYASAASKVASRKSELAKVTASAAGWRTVANALTPYVTVSQQRAQQLAAVRQLAAARFPWPRVLDHIAQLMPSDAALSSLSASSTAGAGTGSAATSSTSTSSSMPSFQLSGCAASQAAVAQTMQQLRGVDGGSSVVLNSANEAASGTGASQASSASSSGSDGSCSYPVTFQMSLTLTGGAAAKASSPSTTAASTTSASTTSASTSSSVASSSSATTGVQAQ